MIHSSKLQYFVFALLLSACHADDGALFDMTVKVLIVDEQDAALTNAFVSIGMRQMEKYPYKGVSTTGRTDTNGFFQFSAKTIGSAAVTVKKYGYYQSEWSGDFFVDAETGAIYPFDPGKKPIRIVLRNIGKPVPMHVNKIDGFIPGKGRFFGYDLIAGDWVAPHGKGYFIDCEFRVDGYWNSSDDNDATLTIRFPGEGNGIKKLTPNPDWRNSHFQTIRFADDIGYSAEYSWRKFRHGPHALTVIDADDGDQFVFKIRAVRSDSGVFEGGMYGKIRGSVMFGGAGETGSTLVVPAYYVNPDKTPNLEFNSDANLFPGDSRSAQTFSP